MDDKPSSIFNLLNPLFNRVKKLLSSFIIFVCLVMKYYYELNFNNWA